MTLPILLTLAHLSYLLERGTLHKPSLMPVASLATIRPTLGHGPPVRSWPKALGVTNLVGWGGVYSLQLRTVDSF